MKKYLVLLVATFMLLFAGSVKAEELPEKTDHEKVTVYLFRGEGCPHCQDFLEWFAKSYYVKGYDEYFDIVSFESWKNTDNQALLLEMKKIVGETEDSSVPLVIVGDDYHRMGFSDGAEIVDAALKEYQNDNYKDIVKETMEKLDKDVNPSSQDLKQAAASEGIKVKEVKKGGLSDGVVVAIIFGVIILGFGGLVVYSRKK